MDQSTPNEHHHDDARADDGPSTDAFTDEVRADAAEAEDDAALSSLEADYEPDDNDEDDGE